MPLLKPCSRKNHRELAIEWDILADERHRQIESGEDVSFRHVVVPLMWNLLKGADLTSVFDIGSGTGEFTLQLAHISGTVTAIEPSKASITLARSVCQSVRNVKYVDTPLEEATSLLDKKSATSAVAVMSLMTAPDLTKLAKTLDALMRPRATFIAVLTHPCFWPRYWGYEHEPWFGYNREIFIEAPFIISRRRTDIITTHIHRPLEQYLSVFSDYGFRLNALAEPMPTPAVQALYPRNWEFPRFLGLRWENFV